MHLTSLHCSIRVIEVFNYYLDYALRLMSSQDGKTNTMRWIAEYFLGGTETFISSLPPSNPHSRGEGVDKKISR